MKEFMFYIRNAAGGKNALSREQHLEFVKKCEVYINRLRAAGNLIAAQPVMREGFILSKHEGNWTQDLIDQSNEVQVGYYHIKAGNMNEAIEIAKENPEFEYVPSASIEIHGIKTSEAETNFVYPK